MDSGIKASPGEQSSANCKGKLNHQGAKSCEQRSVLRPRVAKRLAFRPGIAKWLTIFRICAALRMAAHQTIVEEVQDWDDASDGNPRRV